MNTRASFLIALALALPAMAHEGEDHGAPAEAAPTDVGRAPRAATATETFALLAVGGRDGLTLYLDEVATNAPVDGARIDVQGNGWKAGGLPWVQS